VAIGADFVRQYRTASWSVRSSAFLRCTRRACCPAHSRRSECRPYRWNPT